MLLLKYAKGEVQCAPAVGVSAECFGRDIGRPLVVADYPGHDAAGISDLQGVAGFLGENRDEHTGRSFAEARGSWNHHRGTRSVGWAKADLPANSERDRSCAGTHGDGAVGRRA